MARKEARILEPVVDEQEALAIAEIDEQIAKPHSVVKPAYKLRYKHRAMERGLKGKAAKRSCGDWLAEQLKARVLDKQEKLIVGNLLAIAQANGIDDAEERWPNRSKGWEGRLRMTVGLVLRRIVADDGTLYLPGEPALEAPAEWRNKWETK